ncbi:26171_t:CDS:2, partial [Gigaspora rosea]
DPSNEQDSDERDSDPSDEDIQDPENPSTWRFNEQAVKLNSEEFTEGIEEIDKYPETSKNGVVCVYNVAGMDTEKALEIFDLTNI